jgi:hypothetical protein
VTKEKYEKKARAVETRLKSSVLGTGKVGDVFRKKIVKNELRNESSH